MNIFLKLIEFGVTTHQHHPNYVYKMYDVLLLVVKQSCHGPTRQLYGLCQNNRLLFLKLLQHFSFLVRQALLFYLWEYCFIYDVSFSFQSPLLTQ